MTKVENITSPANEDLIPEFRDEAMGIPTILINSARRVTHDGEPGVIIPDIPGLEAAIAVARVTLPHKLSGREIRFLRRSMGLKAVALAKFLDVTPETLSRWENGPEAISTNAERVLRLRVLQTLKEKVIGIKVRSGDILDLKFSPVRLAHPVALVFTRLSVLSDESLQEAWVFCRESMTETHHLDRASA